MARQYSYQYRNATNNRVPGHRTGIPFFSHLPGVAIPAVAVITAVWIGVDAVFAVLLPSLRDQNDGFDEHDQPIPVQLVPTPAPSTQTKSLESAVHDLTGGSEVEASSIDLAPQTVSPAALPTETSGLDLSIGL